MNFFEIVKQPHTINSIDYAIYAHAFPSFYHWEELGYKASNCCGNRYYDSCAYTHSRF